MNMQDTMNEQDLFMNMDIEKAYSELSYSQLAASKKGCGPVYEGPFNQSRDEPPDIPGDQLVEPGYSAYELMDVGLLGATDIPTSFDLYNDKYVPTTAPKAPDPFGQPKQGGGVSVGSYLGNSYRSRGKASPPIF